MKKETYEKPQVEVYRYFGAVNGDGASGTAGDKSVTCLGIPGDQAGN